jgi:hypothetical protein
MDLNKREKLAEIGYSVRRCCAICIHAQFTEADWGICSKFSYLHRKHKPIGQDGNRGLSIHKSGGCSGFELSEEKLSRLHGFMEFYER